MAVALARGSWTVSEGIKTLWDSAGLDANFRTEWTVNTTDQEPLHDGEVMGTPPGPYCVYEVGDPSPITHQSGHGSDEEIQTLRVPVRFRIHAKTTATETGKIIAIRLAKNIVDAFDPPATLTITPDTHVETIRDGDFHTREDAKTWVWVIQYDFIIDAVYNSV